MRTPEREGDDGMHKHGVPEPGGAREKELLQAVGHAESKWQDAVCSLVGFYEAAGQPASALPHLRRLANASGDSENAARRLLSMGMLCEQSGDFEGAVVCYQRARALEPANRDAWYFVNNNLGFCLNGFGRFEEAESLCRTAIAVDPNRHNAYKNLGLSLQGQHRYSEAAECLLQASERRPDDPRALRHLRDLVGEHPEIAGQLERFAERLARCEGLVAEAGGAS